MTLCRSPGFRQSMEWQVPPVYTLRSMAVSSSFMLLHGDILMRRALAALAAILLSVGSLRAAERPNIVFILADDMRWDVMGCAGNRIIQTPQLDALAKDGMRFSERLRHHCRSARASRASILTGLYERTHRYTFGTKPITAEHVAISYPVLLRQAGYRTGFVGKFGVDVPPGATKADVRSRSAAEPHSVLEETTRWHDEAPHRHRRRESDRLPRPPPSRASRSAYR